MYNTGTTQLYKISFLSVGHPKYIREITIVFQMNKNSSQGDIKFINICNHLALCH